MKMNWKRIEDESNMKFNWDCMQWYGNKTVNENENENVKCKM